MLAVFNSDLLAYQARKTWLLQCSWRHNLVLQETDSVDVRAYLHRDGSVIMPISVEDLQSPQALYQAVGTLPWHVAAVNCDAS